MTEMKQRSLKKGEERDLYYAERLARMIRCRTVSRKDSFEPAEFLKLREVLRELFPLMAEKAELTIRENEYYRPASLDSAGYQYIRSTAEKAFPYAAVAPFILPAGTDARRFADLSDAVIRFAPIDIDSQQYASVHSENENISVDFYKALLRNYQ